MVYGTAFINDKNSTKNMTQLEPTVDIFYIYDLHLVFFQKNTLIYIILLYFILHRIAEFSAQFTCDVKISNSDNILLINF